MQFKPITHRVDVTFTKEQELMFGNFLTQLDVFMTEVCEKKINPYITEEYDFRKSTSTYLRMSVIQFYWDMIDYCNYRKRSDPDGEYDSTMGVYLSVFISGDNPQELFPTVYTCKNYISLWESGIYSEFKIDFSNVTELEKEFEMCLQKIVEFINDSVEHIIYDINNNWKIEE